MKALVSQLLGVAVTNLISTSIDGRRYPAMPLRRWERLPIAARKWLDYRVIQKAENDARHVLRADQRFGPLLEGVRLDWALPCVSLLILLDTMATREVRRIVEFGSGISTSFFAQFAKQQVELGKAPPSIFSFDHDEGWLAQTRSRLESFGLASYVNLQHAPLTEQKLLGRDTLAYTIPEETRNQWCRENDKFDLCLIDGPPASVGRAGSLPIVAPYLAKSAVVYLDDSFRVPEQEILKEWSRAYDGSFRNPLLYLTGHHGLAAIEWEGVG